MTPVAGSFFDVKSFILIDCFLVGNCNFIELKADSKAVPEREGGRRKPDGRVLKPSPSWRRC